MIEIYKDIKGYEDLYQVSNLGNVKSLGNGRTHNSKEHILKQVKTGSGYLKVELSKNGKRKNCLVHRLVAEAFIPNPNNYPIINHRDETPCNNCVENLEWCTVAYNNAYGTVRERVQKTKTEKYGIEVKCLDLETNETTIYPSINEAARQFQVQSMIIWQSIHRYKSPYKKRFVFSEINIEK